MDELDRRRLQTLAAWLAAIMLVALVAAWTARPVPRSAIQPQAIEHRIDVNNAAAHELELLPGIGPSIAWNIVEHRRANGPFAELAGLEQVRMIGPSRRAAVEPWVVLGQVAPHEDP